MKKQISAFALASMLAISPMSVSAHPYERYVRDYDESSGYSYELSEYRVGAYKDSESIFFGCDMYKFESTENIPGFPAPIDSAHNYLLVPAEKFDGIFVFPKNSSLYGEKYDVKLPLSTSRKLDDETLEPIDTHSYNIQVLCRKNPFIRIETDSDEASPLDSEKLAEMFPDIQKKYKGKDIHGNHVYYYSYSFEKYACDAEKLLSESDAASMLKLCNEHTLSFSYCDEYDIQPLPLADTPVYESDSAEKACKVFEEHGISCTTKNTGKGVKIVPEKELPAVEYYTILSEIAEKYGARPNITAFENNIASETISVEMLANIDGDTNCDGSINIADAVFIMQSLANPGKYVLSAQGRFNGDVEGSDGITAKDALEIQKYVLGLSEL